MNQHSQHADQPSRRPKPKSTTQAAAAQKQQESQQIPHPITNDTDAWKAYWQAHHQPWRTEPEINAERQKYLAERRDSTQQKAISHS